MELNLQMQDGHGVGSTHASSSNYGQLAVNWRQPPFLCAHCGRKNEEIEVVMRDIIQQFLNMQGLTNSTISNFIHHVQQQFGLNMSNLILNFVTDENHSIRNKYLAGGNWTNNSNGPTVREERSLHLRFLGEVSAPVLTRKTIEGKGKTPLKVALFDKKTGEVVETGRESSAKVQILVLEACDDGSESNCSLQDFNDRIITDGDKEKPHFRESKYIHLEKGEGVISDAKLEGKGWVNICKCQLGARVVENLGGIIVQEAWTEPFMVSDRRSHLYKKHHPPHLSDDVWRLEKIRKDGKRYKRLRENNVLYVRHFLFFLSFDSQKLKTIVGTGPGTWNVIVNHAQTCDIDDESIFVYRSPGIHNICVAFDIVGGLKGVIRDSHCVPIDNLSEAEKDDARKMLQSAFENWKDLIPFTNEAALLLEYPYEDQHGCIQTNSVSVDRCDLTVHGSSSQWIPTFEHFDFDSRWIDHFDFDSLRMTNTGENRNQMSLPSLEGTNLADVANGSIRSSGNPNFVSFGSITMGQPYLSQLPGPGLNTMYQCPVQDSCFSNLKDAQIQLSSPFSVGSITNVSAGPSGIPNDAFNFGLTTTGHRNVPHLANLGMSSSPLPDLSFQIHEDHTSQMSLPFPECNDLIQAVEAFLPPQKRKYNSSRLLRAAVAVMLSLLQFRKGVSSPLRSSKRQRT